MSPHFAEWEFRCRCCGKLPKGGVDLEHVAKLELLRGMVSAHYEADTPLHILSGHRCKKHNQEVGGEPNSAHLSRTGKVLATDLANPFVGAAGLEALDDYARKAGFIRRGVYVHDNFLHLDSSTKLPQTQWKG